MRRLLLYLITALLTFSMGSLLHKFVNRLDYGSYVVVGVTYKQEQAERPGVCNTANMSTEEIIHKDGSKTIDTYNERGLKVLFEDLDLDGTVIRRIVYRYDSRDNNVEQIKTDGEGKQRWRLLFTFDESNRAIQQLEYDANDELVYRHQYTYGEPNGKIRVKWFDKNGKLLEEAFEDFI